MVKPGESRALDKMLLRLLLWRLLLPSLILTLLAVGLIVYARWHNAETQQLLLARSIAQTVDDHLEHARRMLDAVTQVAEMSTPEELLPYMQATWQAYGHFDALYLLNERDRVTLLVPPDPRYQGADMSPQPFFTQARNQSEIMISQPSISLRAGLPTVYMACPLSDGSLVVGELDLLGLQETIAAEHVEPDQTLIFVTDRSGRLLVHPQSDLVADQTNVGHLKIVQRGLTGPATLRYFADGSPVLGSTAPVEQTGWLVVAQTPLLATFSPYLLWAAGDIFLLSPVVWLVVLWMFRRQLKRHIVDLLTQPGQGVNTLADGDFSQGATLAAEQEQRLLAETLAEVTLALASRIGYQAVLKEILYQAQRLVPYRTAHIVLLEDSTLHIASWQGYQASEGKNHISRLVQPLNSLPLDAEVIRSRKPVVISDTHQDRRWVVFDETAWVKSHISVPICLRDRVLGLIRLDGDTPGEFSPEDAERLEPLASAAAIAIHNANLYEQVQRHATELEQHVAERTRELAEANKRLQELDRLKSKFVSNVSHELRTPVANISVYLHLLERQPENYAQHIPVLKEQSNRLSDLIEDILSLARLDLGPEKVKFAPTDLNAIIEQVVNAQLPRAEAAGLELLFEPDVAIPPVRAERNQLAQVVTNLVVNALNYTPSGQVRISTQLVPERSQVCLEVQDTGMGIEPEDMPHLFERFYRGQKVAQSNIPGTGLGLAIAKEIVDLHGGEIEIESQPGKGSNFRVWLMLAEKEQHRPA
jgi:signal transduction histidine kinase